MLKKTIKAVLPWVGDFLGALSIFGSLWILCVLVWALGL